MRGVWPQNFYYVPAKQRAKTSLLTFLRAAQQSNTAAEKEKKYFFSTRGLLKVSFWAEAVAKADGLEFNKSLVGNKFLAETEVQNFWKCKKFQKLIFFLMKKNFMFFNNFT